MKRTKLILTITKAVCGAIGGALVLTENHPYITLVFLAIGAGANEAVNFINTEE
jgi:hypothetical protein